MDLDGANPSACLARHSVVAIYAAGAWGSPRNLRIAAVGRADCVAKLVSGRSGCHGARDAREQTGRSFASAAPLADRAARRVSGDRCDAIELRPLVQSRTHGLSYATVLGRLRRQGPSVLVVRDKGGFVFGCYASESWERRTRFYGDSKCFVFSLSPLLRRFPTVSTPAQAIGA